MDLEEHFLKGNVRIEALNFPRKFDVKVACLSAVWLIPKSIEVVFDNSKAC